MENVKTCTWIIDYGQRPTPGDESCELCQDGNNHKSYFNLDLYYVHITKNLGDGKDREGTATLCSDCIYECYRLAKDTDEQNVHFFAFPYNSRQREPWSPSESSMDFLINKDIKD